MRRSVIFSSVAGVILFAAIAYTAWAISNNTAAPIAPPVIPAPAVSVIEVTPGTYRAHIQVFGEVRPLHEVELKAQVEGQIQWLHPTFNSGDSIKTGHSLLQIDDTQYRQVLAGAERELADAQVTLLQQQRQQQQAEQEWKQANLGGEPDSPLVLRKPQLKAAQASVFEAKARLQLARRDLVKTRFESPFDALIVSRDVSNGDYLQQGDTVATLYDVSKVEVRLALAAWQWDLLGDQRSGSYDSLSVLLRSVSQSAGKSQEPQTSKGVRSWQATLQRVERHIELQNRQRALVVAVDNPLDKKLLPGTFVKAHLMAKEVHNLLAVPASSLSSDGEILYVTQDNRLARYHVQPVFKQQGKLFIPPPETLSINGSVSFRVLTQPLQGLKQGLQL
jgi:membrane fusion protein, multidrug efflux system